MFGSPLPPVVCWRARVFLCYLCLFAYLVVSNTSWLCEEHGWCLIRGRDCYLLRGPGFTSGFLWSPYCSSFWFPVSWCVLFCLSSSCVLCLVYMLPVSLDCPFLIAPLVFSDAYLHYFQFVLLVAAYNDRPTIQHTMYLFYKILVYKTCQYVK